MGTITCLLRGGRAVAGNLFWAWALAVLAAASAHADSITATKTKNPDGTHSEGGTKAFSLATDQLIEWEATYTDSGTAGNDFYLHHPGQPLNEIPLSTNLLSGPNTGTHFLTAGNYEISTSFYDMGVGSYTIKYNHKASIAASPTSLSFGSLLTGEVSSPKAFTVKSTGDVDVTISGITASDPVHFEIVPPGPVGQSVPPDRSVQVRCKAGSVPGDYVATITVSGTHSLGPGLVSAVVTASCKVEPRVPNISFAGSPNLGTADWSVGEVKTFHRSFSNTGTGDLLLTSITLVNDSAPGAFSLDGSPSLAPVAPGGSRPVAIRFAPPPSGGEAVYSGHLVIQSNDPDQPTANALFQATAHHPAPRARLKSTLLDYREVETGFEFTQAIAIYNDGDAPLNVSVSSASPADPNLAHYRPETGSASVNPLAAPAQFRQVYAPQAVGGPHTVQLTVSGDDPVNLPQLVTLTGRCIAPVPIDGVLVLDRSGSMVEQAGARRKIDALQVAADLFTHLLRRNPPGAATGDRLGFVRYNHVNDVYLPLNYVEPTATPGSHLEAAENKLSNAAIADVSRLRPDGFTGIGGAMQTAAAMLVGSPADRKHVMVVLTDGMENRTPWIGDVLGPIQGADPRLRMYSVGLGSVIEPGKLQAITNVTNGYHQVADDLSGPSIYDLETFYFKIFANATGMQLAVDPAHLVNLNGTTPTVVERARVVSSDRSVTFVVFEIPLVRPFYVLELLDPQGKVVGPGSTVGGVPVYYLRRHDYTIYRVVLPPLDQTPSYLGDWVLRLTPRGKWTPAVAERLQADLHKAGWQVRVDPARGLTPIGFAAAVASNCRMEVQVRPSSFLPGADVKLTASLSDRGWPLKEGAVEVDVSPPTAAGPPSTLRLYDDGSHGDTEAHDGTWTGNFTQTGASGSYRFAFHGVVKNERGELAPREATRYLTLGWLPPCDCDCRDKPRNP